MAWFYSKVTVSSCAITSVGRPPHSAGRRFRYAHGDHRFFSKIIPTRRGSVDNHTIWGLDSSSTLPLLFYYVSATLLLRFTMTMKIRLRLGYADGDAASTLLRPRRRSYAFVALLFPFYILIRSYTQLNVNDRRAQVAML